MNAPVTRTTRWLLAVLALALLPLAQLVGAARAQADTTLPTDSVCYLGLDGSASSCAPTRLPSPGLVNPHYLGSDETRAAMHRLEDQAVALTLAHHSLPASDAEAVKSWARADAQAELWGLIVQAVQTPSAQRTPDQQAAVTWIASLDRSMRAWAGRNAGLEYTRWAGLSTKRYWELVNGGASQTALTDFLHTSVEPHAVMPDDQGSGGYCDYKPPAPYQDEYSGSTAQGCGAPCPEGFGCYVPTPTFDQFARWGAATASAATAGGLGYAVTSTAIASAAIFGYAMAGAGATALGLGVAEGLGVLGTTLTDAVLGLAGNLIINVGVVETLPVIEEIGLSTFTFVGAGIASEALLIGGVVGIVVYAIINAVLEGIRVVDNDALPGKVAQLVVQSQQPTDPVATIGTPSGAALLFHAFVFATQPAPGVASTCEDRPGLLDYRLGLVKDLGDGSFLYYAPDSGRTVEHDGYECLNPTALPAPRDTDPQFLVEPRERQPSDPAEPARTRSITVADDEHDVSSTVRLSDSWFVTHLVVGQKTFDAQSLALGYTDWHGAKQLAWLVRDDEGGYEFVGRALDTGQSDGDGWSSRSIEYTGPGGRQYRASVAGYQPPVNSPTYLPRSPVEGTPVSFLSNGFVPGGATVLSPTYSWRFQDDSCAHPCGDLGSRPSYGPPVTGRGVTHTWQAPGTYSVELTVTGEHGEKAVTTMQVPVGGVAPVLDLAPSCAAVSSVTMLTCNASTVHTGSSTVVAGGLTHTGTHDRERITVDWGDGTPAQWVEVGPWAALTAGDPPIETHDLSSTRLAWQTGHVYAVPGSHVVTVWATDTAGLTDTQTLAVDVRGPQALTFTLPAHATYGDRLPLAQPTGGSGRPVAYTATPESVCTADSTALHLVGVGDCTVTARQDGDGGLYEAAIPVVRTVSVDPAPLRVAADPVTRVYGQAQPELTVQATGLRNGDTLADLAGLTVTGAPEDAHAGDYHVVPTGITNPEYAVTYATAPERVTPARLTITAEDRTRRYGDPIPTYTVRYDGLVAGDTPADIGGVQLTGAAGAAPRVGTYPIGIVGRPTNPDYTYSLRNGTETVTPARLTITADDVTTRSGQAPHYTWTVTGLVNGDHGPRVQPTCRATVQGVAVAASTRPGSYARAVTCSGASDAQYTIDYVAGSLTVNPVVSIDQTGLPATLPARATFDGKEVTLPLSPTEVAYGSAHTVELPPLVAGPDQVLHWTSTGYDGPVTDDLQVIASYTTMADLVAAARAEGLATVDANGLLDQWTAVENAVAASRRDTAQPLLSSWAHTVESWRAADRLSPASAHAMAGFAQAVYTVVGGDSLSVTTALRTGAPSA